jgi:hypothetical protein
MSRCRCGRYGVVLVVDHDRTGPERAASRAARGTGK